MNTTLKTKETMDMTKFRSRGLPLAVPLNAPPERPSPGQITVKPPPTEFQEMLFDIIPDKKLGTNGEARTRYGRIVEEIVCSLLGLTDITNSGTYDAVFDAFGHGAYCEIKSVRKNNKCPIYEWRRKKDRAAKVPLVYLLCMHECRGAKTLTEAFMTMAQTLNEIYVASLDTIDQWAEGEEIRQLVKEEKGSRMGYKRKGYCEGYRNISATKVTQHHYLTPIEVEAELYDVPLKARVWVDRSLDDWFNSLQHAAGSPRRD